MSSMVKRIPEVFRKYRGNVVVHRFVSLFSVDALVKLSGFLLLPIYLRLMTQAEYGFYNYLLSIVSTIAIILNFGFYAGQSKYVHDYRGAKARGSVLFTVQAMVLMGLALVLAPIYLAGLDGAIFRFVLKPEVDYATYRMPLLMAILASVLSFMFTNYLLSTEKVRKVQVLNVVRLIAFNGLIVLALYLVPADKAKLRFILNYGFELVLILGFLHVLVRELWPRFSPMVARKTLVLGLPLMINAVVGIFVNFGDKFFLQKHGSYESLSLYFLAFSIASLVVFVYTSFQNIWLPLLLKEQDFEKAMRESRKVAIVSLGGLLGLCVAMYFATWIALLLHVFPDKYWGVLRVLPLVLLAQWLSCWVTYIGNYIVYFGKTFFVAIFGALWGGASVLLNSQVIPRWGVIGAACVLCFINFSYLTTYFTIVRKAIQERRQALA